MKIKHKSQEYGDAVKIYNIYHQKEGSIHIATPLSICVLRDLVQKAKSVLEMGAGIGTLTYTMLTSSDVLLDIYEDNDFCIAQLKKNLQQFEGRYTLLTSYRQRPPRECYDLVIVDGGNGEKHDGGDRHVISEIFSLIVPKVIYIEGVRRPQRKKIRESLHKRCAIHITKVPYFGEFKGGTVYTCYNAPSLIRELQYWWNELREHPRFENFFTKIKPPKQTV